MNLLSNFRKLPVFKIVPIESDYTEIAITDDPAIEEYFLKFSNEEVKLDFNSDKQIITGPVMVPEKLLYRNDSLGERFVTYDAEGIQKAVSLFMKNGFKFNQSHTDTKLPIEILESYFTKEGNEFDVPAGSWVVSAKVNDSELWTKLKEQNLGFSFQAMFNNELIGAQELIFNKDKEMNLKEKLSAAINAVLFNETPEVFEAVEVPVEVAPVVEEAVEEQEEVKPLSKEEISEMIDEAIVAATEQIMASIKDLVGQVKESEVAMSAMKTQLEEFSRQPITQPIVEVVNNNPAGSTYGYLLGVQI